MKRVILLLVSILLISLAYSFAEVPCKINYQGRLIKDNVPVDGTRTMVFSIYDSDNNLKWTSGNVSVEVHNGLFRYVLGEGFVGGNPVTDLSSIPWTAGETLYLEVKVETDILTPREAIYAYPYAINSHLLEGATKEYFLNTSAGTQTKQGDLNIMGSVGIGTTSPGAKLDVNGEIKCSGFADHFGMNWHEAVAEKHNSVGWATAVDYSGSGVLLYVQGYGRWLEPLNNHIRITIDGEVWRDYTGLARTAGANGWNILDDTGDNNSGVITLMPFKKFSSGLKVEIYNADSSSESSVRVNYLTP